MTGTLFKHPDGKIHVITLGGFTLISELEIMAGLHGIKRSPTTPYGFWIFDGQIETAISMLDALQVVCAVRHRG